MYLGYPTWVHGYDSNSISVDECGDGEDCPVFDRLVGSRIAIASVEARLQLLGTQGYGLISFPYMPLQLSGFFDAGMAWSSDEPVVVAWEERGPRRVPVFSAGMSARIPLFGALPLEIYAAKPFQRPDENIVWGFQIAPGW